jgi:hypothetical protein
MGYTRATICIFIAGLDRKLVSHAYYANEVESELRSKNRLDLPFRSTTNYKLAIAEIEKMRQDSVLYSHNCSEMGMNRGCPNLHVFDGVWKIGFPHCAMKMKVCKNSSKSSRLVYYRIESVDA